MATVEFLKAGTPYGWAFVAGEVGVIPGEAAAHLAAAGVVKIIGLADAQAPHEQRETKIVKPKEVRKK